MRRTGAYRGRAWGQCPCGHARWWPRLPPWRAHLCRCQSPVVRDYRPTSSVRDKADTELL